MPDCPQGERISGKIRLLPQFFTRYGLSLLPLALAGCPIHISNNRRTDAKAPPPLFSQGAGSAGHFHPLGSRGEVSLTKREGAERRKALVRNAAPRGPTLRSRRSLQREGTDSPER